jgi:hypothetical protein
MAFFVMLSIARPVSAAPTDLAAMPLDLTLRLASGELTQPWGDAEVLPWKGKTIYTLKAIDTVSQQPQAWSWDETGALLDDRGAALRKQERVARRADRGSLSDELWNAVADLRPGQTYPVLIWLPTQESTVDKVTLLADAEAAAAEKSQREAGQADARSKLLAAAPWLQERLSTVTGTPAVVAELTREEVLALAPVPGIVDLLPFRPGKPASSTSYVDTINASYGTTSLSGNGVKVCLVEERNPDASTYTQNSSIGGFYCSGALQNSHARCTAAMIRSTDSPYGSAKNASEYWGGYVGCTGGDTPERGLDYCATNAIHVWNAGFTLTSGFDALFDYYAKHSPYPLITVPTGQTDDDITACPTACSNTPSASAANGWSVLIVGGSRDCETADRSDDKAFCYAYSANPVLDREVPHVVAPAYLLNADTYVCGSGTSWASALTAGAATQLIETNSALATWPEAIRSILMTTATVSVDGVTLNLNDAVDDRDGAGEIDVSLADRLGATTAKKNGGNTACDFGHDYGPIDSTSTPAGNDYSESYNIYTASAGQRTRVVLTWDGTGTCSSLTDATTCSSDSKDADLEILLYQGTTLLSTSQSTRNSFEFLEFAPAANTNYTVRIHAYSWNASSTYYGISWFTGSYTTN